MSSRNFITVLISTLSLGWAMQADSARRSYEDQKLTLNEVEQDRCVAVDSDNKCLTQKQLKREKKKIERQQSRREYLEERTD